MGAVSKRPQPYHLQSALPKVSARLQAELSGDGYRMSKLSEKGAKTEVRGLNNRMEKGGRDRNANDQRRAIGCGNDGRYSGIWISRVDRTASFSSEGDCLYEIKNRVERNGNGTVMGSAGYLSPPNTAAKLLRKYSLKLYEEHGVRICFSRTGRKRIVTLRSNLPCQ